MKNTILLLIVSFIFLLFFSCEKDIVPKENDSDRINASVEPTLIEWNNNGLGIYFGYPSGEQFALPEKVFLYEDKVFNHSFSFPYNNAITNCSFQQYGGDGIPLYMFIYTELSNCTLKIPGGMIFYTPRDSSQNLFVIKDVFIPLERFNFIEINTFCLNHERVNKKGDPYVFGPQTNHPELSKIPSILNDKEDIFNDWENYYVIQDIIWNITDGSGKIREEDIAFLKSLP